MLSLQFDIERVQVKVLSIRISASVKSEGAEAIDSSDDLDRVSTVKSSYPKITESQVFSLGGSTKRSLAWFQGVGLNHGGTSSAKTGRQFIG